MGVGVEGNVLINRIFKITGLLSLIFVCSWENLYASEKLVLGTWEWAPITSSRIDGYGLASEIVQKAYEAEGEEIEFRFFPWKRCELMVSSEEVDAVFPYSPTEEREKNYYFSDPILSVKTKLFFLNDQIDKLTLNSYEDLKKYSIGGVLGYFYEKRFEEAGLDVEYVGTDDANLKKLIHRRVDIIPMAGINGLYLIERDFPEYRNKIGYVDFDSLGRKEIGGGNTVNVMVAKNNPDAQSIIQRFNRGIIKIKQNGQYQKILKKYDVRQTVADLLIDQNSPNHLPAIDKELAGAVCLGENLSVVASEHSDRLYLTVGNSEKIYFKQPAQPPRLVLKSLPLDQDLMVKVYFDDRVVSSWPLNYSKIDAGTVIIWRAKGSWRMDPIDISQCREMR